MQGIIILKSSHMNCSTYVQVKSRASNHNTYRTGSHVLQFGDFGINVEELELYIGYDPKNENVSSPMLPRLELANSLEGPKDNGVNQRDADLLHFWHKV